MPEANATVDPFESAGVQLPTQGKGYSGTDSATNVAIGAALGGLVPQNNVLPGPQTFVAVDIPFAAPGEVIEVTWSFGATPDNSNLTPGTLIGAFPGISDSSLVPQTFFLQSGICTSQPAALTLTDFANLMARTCFEVPPGLVYPLTVFLTYSADGDFLIGNNGVVGLTPMPVNFLVQRVTRNRVLELPPVNLI